MLVLRFGFYGLVFFYLATWAAYFSHVEGESLYVLCREIALIGGAYSGLAAASFLLLKRIVSELLRRV